MGYDLALALVGLAACIAAVKIVRMRAWAYVSGTQMYYLRRQSQSEDINFVTEARGPDPSVLDQMCRHNKPSSQSNE